jgi:hypothetical protein
MASPDEAVQHLPAVTCFEVEEPGGLGERELEPWHLGKLGANPRMKFAVDLARRSPDGHRAVRNAHEFLLERSVTREQQSYRGVRALGVQPRDGAPQL